VTKSPLAQRCRWCGRGFEVLTGPGRPKQFCKASCRQQDYVARRRAGEVGLSESELIVARRQLDELHDRLYVLEAAIEDVDRDLAEADDPSSVREALDWLLDAARPVVEQRFEPSTGPSS
jgi:hypothetical protein